MLLLLLFLGCTGHESAVFLVYLQQLTICKTSGIQCLLLLLLLSLLVSCHNDSKFLKLALYCCCFLIIIVITFVVIITTQQQQQHNHHHNHHTITANNNYNNKMGNTAWHVRKNLNNSNTLKLAVFSGHDTTGDCLIFAIYI